MIGSARLGLVLLLAAAGNTTAAAPLSHRLPQDAWLIAEIDVDALRAGGWIDASQASQDPLMAALRRGGFVPGRDVSRLALAVLAGAPEHDGEPVVLAKARFDRKAVEAALLGAGGESVDLAGSKAVRMPMKELRFADGGLSLELDEPLIVSFLEDAIVVGTRRASKAARDAKTPPGLLLSAARKAIPGSAAHWLVADLTRQSRDGGSSSAATKELRTVAAWASGGEALDLRAVARAIDARSAAQAAALAPLALAFVGAGGSGGSLEDVHVEASEEEVRGRARLVRVAPAK